MRKIAFIALLLIVVGCSNSQTQTETDNNAEINEFISALDDKSLDEILEEVNTNIKQFERFIEFFDETFGNEIEKINKEDERYDSVFKIDTTGIGNALQQFDNVQFTQTFGNNQSNLKFNFKNTDKRKPTDLGAGVGQGFTANKIYYHDGTTKTENLDNSNVDFIFAEDDWGPAKPIDSIDITYKVNYLTDYDVVEVSVDNSKATYKNGEINLVKTQDNYAYITFSDTISDYVTIQGYNAEGNILDRRGSSSNAIAPKDSKGIFSEMEEYFKILQKKLNDGDFENTAELQEFLSKNLSKLDYFNDKDGLFHDEYYYYGTVKSFKIYFEKNTESRQIKFTARNSQPLHNPNELFNMQTKDGLVFFNVKGDPQITIKNSENGITKLGGDFYEDMDHFYVLNRTKKRLDTLLVFNVIPFSNGLVGIQPEQKDDDFLLYSSEYSRIGDKKYWNVREVGHILFATRNEKYYILDEKGNETLVPNVTRLSEKLSKNRIMASNQNGIGYIDSKGKTVIPFKYDEAEDFEDGITTVKFDGTYKLIDVNGKILVDTGENYLNYFQTDDQGKRIYNFDFGAKVYNYKGELVSEK